MSSEESFTHVNEVFLLDGGKFTEGIDGVIFRKRLTYSVSFDEDGSVEISLFLVSGFLNF